MTPAINLLKKHNIAHTLYPYECDVDNDLGGHAAHKLNVPKAQLFKTLIAHHKEQVIVAIIPSSHQCSLKLLAKTAGLKK